MELSTERAGRAVVVIVQGDVDVGNVGALRQRLDELLASGEHNVVVDLSGVGRMDVSAFATLVQAFKRARAGHGGICVCGLRAESKRMFELIRLDRILRSFDDRDHAIASLGAVGGSDGWKGYV